MTVTVKGLIGGDLSRAPSEIVSEIRRPVMIWVSSFMARFRRILNVCQGLNPMAVWCD